jgi:dTDP-4-dehydrorhamnose reductase
LVFGVSAGPMLINPILITGGSGQLATCLELAAGGLPVRRIGRPELDFDAPGAIGDILAAIAPRMIVNAAAYTAVDKAESEVDAADRANRLGPKLLADYAAHAGIPLIHVSTDYVFDGAKGAAYVETDAPSPTGVYGTTKLAGEQAVLAAHPRSIVLRTSWVYSAVGRNFLLTMLNAAQRMPKLRVVADQIGNPTNAHDLAEAIITIAAMIERDGWSDSYQGVFHAAGSGFTSWHGFAGAIFRHAAPHGAPVPEIEAIGTADWPTPARRPVDSRLDCGRIADVFGVQLPAWDASLKKTIDTVFGAHGAFRRVP